VAGKNTAVLLHSDLHIDGFRMVVGQDPQIVVVESHVLLAVWHKVEAIVRLVESPDLHDRAPGDVQSPVDHRHHHMNGTRQIHADHPQGEDILVVESLEPHPSTPTLEAAQPIPADHHEEGQVVVEVLVGFRQLLVPGGHKSGGGQGAGLTPNPPVGDHRHAGVLAKIKILGAKDH